jgi:hypothetical protein
MINSVLTRWIAAPERARALSVALQNPPSQHLDDEAAAALLEDAASAAELAHVTRCPECARRLDTLAALHLERPPESRARLADPVPLLVASVHLAGGRPPDVSATSGSVRVVPSLLTRAGDASPALALRDTSDKPNFEIGLVCPPGNLRFNLHVNWLQGGNPPQELQVARDGRVLSRSPFLDRNASAEGLRPGAIQVTIHRTGSVIARAWLHCERT